MPETPDPAPRAWVLRCHACGTTVDCPPADIRRFSKEGKWPRCCGEVMTLVTADTGRPPPPCY